MATYSVSLPMLSTADEASFHVVVRRTNVKYTRYLASLTSRLKLPWCSRSGVRTWHSPFLSQICAVIASRFRQHCSTTVGDQPSLEKHLPVVRSNVRQIKPLTGKYVYANTCNFLTPASHSTLRTLACMAWSKGPPNLNPDHVGGGNTRPPPTRQKRLSAVPKKYSPFYTLDVSKVVVPHKTRHGDQYNLLRRFKHLIGEQRLHTQSLFTLCAYGLTRESATLPHRPV